MKRLIMVFAGLGIVFTRIFVDGLTRWLIILGIIFAVFIALKTIEICEDDKDDKLPRGIPRESTVKSTSKYSSNNASKYTGKDTGKDTSLNTGTSTNTSTSTDSSISPLDKTIAYEVVETLIDKQFVTLVTESDLKEAWEHRNNYDSEDIEYLKEHGWERCLTPESIRIYLIGPACEVFIVSLAIQEDIAYLNCFTMVLILRVLTFTSTKMVKLKSKTTIHRNQA